MALPTNVGYGTVTGRFLIAQADGTDNDLFPDGVPVKGRIIFTPRIEKLRNSVGSEDPVTIIPMPATCTIDTDGYLNGPDGEPGVRLIATSDSDNKDPELNVTASWDYEVRYQLTDQSDIPLRGIPTHGLTVPVDSEIDLIDVFPVELAS